MEKIGEVMGQMGMRSWGWESFDARAKRVIAMGASTPEAYEKHLREGYGEKEGGGGGFMRSRRYYLDWKANNPEQKVPDMVNRILNDDEFASWRGLGFTLDSDAFFRERLAVYAARVHAKAEQNRLVAIGVLPPPPGEEKR